MEGVLIGVGLTIWILSFLGALLITVFQNKLKIKDKVITYLWDLVKVITGLYLGALFGSSA